MSGGGGKLKNLILKKSEYHYIEHKIP